MANLICDIALRPIAWAKYLFAPKGYKDISWWTVIRCRWKGHLCGVHWYNANGMEPDMTCKNCGDDLG